MGDSQSKQGSMRNTSQLLPVCALLKSAVACAASLYHLRMASSSISTQTWPYVTIGWRYVNNKTDIVVDDDLPDSADASTVRKYARFAQWKKLLESILR